MSSTGLIADKDKNSFLFKKFFQPNKNKQFCFSSNASNIIKNIFNIRLKNTKNNYLIDKYS